MGTMHTYTVWDGINWGGDSRRLKNFILSNDALSDSYGIVKYGGYFAGAATSTFGQVGDMLLVVETDGVIYSVIIADEKNQNDRGCNIWGHHNGRDIIEFEVLSSCRKGLYNGSGWYISELINKPIYKVINLGSVFESTYYFWDAKQACIDNGLVGYYLLDSPYGGNIVEYEEDL